MSLLLDALKKAALEKQRREQPGREPLGREVFGHEVPPAVSQQSAPVSQPAPAPVKIEPVDELNTDGLLTDASDSVADENLIFNIDEVGDIDSIGDLDTRYLDAILETTSIEVTSNHSITTVETIGSEEDVKTTISETLGQAASIVEANVDADVEAHVEAHVEARMGEHIAPHITPPFQPNAPESKVPEPPTSETTFLDRFNVAPIEQFNVASGKTALAQLLQRSQKATTFARRRILIMYGLLALTALTVLIFYYYLLQNDTASVIVIPNNPLSSQPLVTGESDAALNSPDASTPVEPASEITTASAKPASAIKPEVLAKQSAPVAQTNLVGQPKRLQRKPVVNDERRNSTALAPEFVTKEAIISHQKTEQDRLNEAVERGYAAYQRGDLTGAAAAYSEALAEDPNQRDALLGSAAVAVREGRQQDALGLYQQRLARAPKDDYALAGVMALHANGDQNPQFESELTSLLHEYPNASHLHFLQGSLYAARQQWDSAQVAFFEAWQRDTKNPDIAFNLAVALDHLSQPKEAVRFYQQALTLGSDHSVGFVKDAVERRLKQLESHSKQENPLKSMGDQP